MIYARSASAQLKITFPVSRMVIQRNNSNQATVQIAGSYSLALDSVEARVVARVAGQGTTTNWTTIQNNPTNGQFKGTLIVNGGWYTIQVRGRSGGVIIATDELDRFGVGEVFAIMGHSNAQGSACTINGTDQCTTISGASDDRVNVVAVDQSSATFQPYLTTGDTRYLPGLVFSQLTTTSGMAPFAKVPWLWGHMGDVLVARINVPVLLYNAGFGGTNMQQTYWAAYDIPFQHSFVRYTIRMPFANIRNLMNLYVPTTGLRAVLVQHGENDRDNPTDSTYKYYRKVIEKIRTEFNKPNLAHIIALSSYVGGQFQNVRSAQTNVISSTPYTYLGPDLDTDRDRPDGIHFSPTGQVKAGGLWANAITDAYLSSITPYQAQEQPLASIICAGNNQLMLSQPEGMQPIWNTGSTATYVTVGAGTYSARIKDAQNKVLFPPAIVVPASVQPDPPTISSLSGTLSICQNGGLTLISSYAGPNTWNTGGNAPAILAMEPGIYSVEAKNAVYGCLSAPVSQTIGLATVDLSLFIQASRRVAALNDTVSYRLIVKNNSGCDARMITLENRLPPNVTIESTSGELSVLNADDNGNTLISGQIPQILAHQSVTSNYVARLTADGMYISAAELVTTANPLLRGTPGNGTGNGEADEARTDLRTLTSSSALFQSPNPLQKPLPEIISNQPLPEADKVDLSLRIQSNKRVVKVGSIVSFTLTVTNGGALTATNVGITTILPSGLQFNNSSAMLGNGSLVNAVIAQIQTGQVINLEFTARVTAPGALISQAQIDACDQIDADSTPGNGYLNGEDDRASFDLRAIL
ncbi:hypothetical protein [Spirosoma sp. KNUC1025]|uniref:hypothetical protein n=1 Tax=Spirosoma sp. KNUC1025 TaxID=2894082 RepID=UPI0038671C49|nr:DUF11 domain-containing protein [Spirosoma sp. KNUC1025]